MSVDILLQSIVKYINGMHQQWLVLQREYLAKMKHFQFINILHAVMCASASQDFW